MFRLSFCKPMEVRVELPSAKLTSVFATFCYDAVGVRPPVLGVRGVRSEKPVTVLAKSRAAARAH